MKTMRWMVTAIVWSVLLVAGSVGAQAVGTGTMTASPVSLALGTPVTPHGARDAADMQDSTDETIRYSRPVIRVGQDYTLRKDEVVGELHTVFGAVTIEGHVEGDTSFILGPVHLTSTAVIERSLIVFGGNVTIDEGAVVRRDLAVVGGALQAPTGFAPGGNYAVVGTADLGNAFQAVVPWITRGLLWGRLFVPDLPWVRLVAGIAFLLVLALNLLFSNGAKGSAEALAERPLGVFFLGLLIFILTIPVVILLGATVIGLLVVPFLLFALLVAGLVGKAGVCRLLGHRLLGAWSRETTLGALAAFLTGAVLLMLLYMLPVLGIVTWGLTSVLAMGSAAVMLRRRMRRESRQAAAVASVVGGDGVDLPNEPRAYKPPRTFESATPQPVPDFPASQDTFRMEAAAPTPDVPPIPPPPSPTSVPGGFPRAAFLDRLGAFAIDALLVAIVTELLHFSHHDGVFAVLLVAYHVAFWAWKRTTLGGIVIGLRVDRLAGGELRFVDSLVRGLTGLFSVAAFGIGCFWMINDPERQMWHDKIAGTVVSKVPREVALG